MTLENSVDLCACKDEQQRISMALQKAGARRSPHSDSLALVVKALKKPGEEVEGSSFCFRVFEIVAITPPAIR